MRRLAVIGTGAAVAAVLILPAAAAWLREPEARPLPEPIHLQGSPEYPQPGSGARDRRRPVAGARPAELAPAAAGRATPSSPPSARSSSPARIPGRGSVVPEPDAAATNGEDAAEQEDDVAEQEDDGEEEGDSGED
jgi:hypothetical protein